MKIRLNRFHGSLRAFPAPYLRDAFLTSALCLLVTAPCAAAGLLSAPLLKPPPTAATNAFISFDLMLETTEGGQIYLQRYPELARLTRLNFEGFWGAGTLEVLLRHAPKDLPQRVSAAVNPKCPEADITLINWELGQARAKAKRDILRIAKAVEQDIERSEYDFDDIFYLGLRADELAGLAVLDDSAKPALEKVYSKQEALVRERLERVYAYIHDGAAALSGKKDDDLIVRMGDDVLVAVGPDDVQEQGMEDVESVIEVFERDWSLPRNREFDTYPPSRPSSEEQFFRPEISLDPDSIASAKPVMETQVGVVSIAVPILRELLPKFSAGLFKDEKVIPAAYLLSSVLGTIDFMHLGFWKDLAESLAGLQTNGEEVRDALRDDMESSLRTIKDGPPAPEIGRPVLSALANAIRDLPRSILMLRQEYYNDIKSEQGLPVYPSLSRSRPGSKNLQMVGQAIESGQDIRFTYRSRAGETTTRTITPREITTVYFTRCVEGWCHLRKAERVFAIGRMRDISVVEKLH